MTVQKGAHQDNKQENNNNINNGLSSNCVMWPIFKNAPQENKKKNTAESEHKCCTINFQFFHVTIANATNVNCWFCVKKHICAQKLKLHITGIFHG
jgi:hypothetical protein